MQEQFNQDKFQSLFDDFERLGQESIDVLPGPRHPSLKYYQARKNKQTFTNVKRNYKSSTNPERADKRAKERSHQKFNYELSQYLYTNKRKTLVNKSSGPDNVLPRALKSFNFNTIMAVIFTIISLFNIIPSNMRKARTVLRDKKGHIFKMANWRPIS